MSKKKEVASQKSTKASIARAGRQSLKKAKLRKGGKAKGPFKKPDGAADKKGGKPPKKSKTSASGKKRKSDVAKKPVEKTAGAAVPKMRLKRPLTAEEKAALKAKAGNKYWTLYKEMQDQFKTDKTKHDALFALGARAKQLWEVVRCEQTPADERMVKAKELYRLVRGKVSKVVNAQDLSRVIECLMQHGDVEIRAGLFEELKTEIAKLSKSKYAHFFVLKVLKYGSKDQRDHVMASFRGDVPELMNHKVAAAVVEAAYNDWANAVQRGLLQQEFYSPAYAQFKDTGVTSLDRALEAEGADKEKILGYMREKLDPIVDKGLIQHNLIQTLLLEYLTHCGEADGKDMIDNIKEQLIHMIHTREGARVAMHCIWNTSAKDRKAIMKSWKTHVARIAKDEHGYLALIALIDAVDDTKVLDKAVLRELVAEIHDVALHEVGRKVVLYLVSPRNKKYFHPDVLKILARGDGNAFSKKDMKIRHEEVTNAVRKDVLAEVCGNVARYAAENSATWLAMAVVEHFGRHEDAASEVSKLHSQLAELMARPFEPRPSAPRPAGKERPKKGVKRKSSAVEAMDSHLPGFMRQEDAAKGGAEDDPESEMHVVEKPATHMLIKDVLTLDAGHGSFCEEILRQVSDENLHKWVTCNRGCFVIVKMLECEVDDVTAKLKKRLSRCRAELQKSTLKGAEILRKKLFS